MKRCRKIFLSLVVFSLMGALQIQAQSLNERIYTSFIAGDMKEWSRVMDEMESIWEDTHSIELLYDLTLAQYGYTAYSLSVDKKDMARELVKKAEKNALRMIEYDPEWARAHALLGAIYGFKVGMEPYKVFRYAHRAFEENSLAFELAPKDPQVWMERANIELYKPSIFGGDKKDAITYYKKAIELYEKDENELKHNWLYLNSLNGLAISSKRTGDIKMADITYRKILRVEPEIIWIRDRDYPQFKERYKDDL